MTNASHFRLAGYNHLDVAEFLLEAGADVNAQDKGGLIPLHNASSYGVISYYSKITRFTLRNAQLDTVSV